MSASAERPSGQRAADGQLTPDGQAAADGQTPAGDSVAVGDAALSDDAALAALAARLRSLDGQPVADHPAVLEEVHRAVVAELDVLASSGRSDGADRAPGDG